MGVVPVERFEAFGISGGNARLSQGDNILVQIKDNSVILAKAGIQLFKGISGFRPAPE